MSSVLQIKDLEFAYPKAEPLLHGVTLAVGRGELVWITGPAGCGKSTLLQLILGDLQPSEGRVEILGKPVHGRRAWPSSYLRRLVGLLRQEERLLPEKSLYANVELPLQIKGFRKGRRRKRVVQVLDSLDLLGRASLPAGQLAASEQRLTVLARALVSSPPLLLAELGPGKLEREVVLTKLREAAAFGSAAVIFSQNRIGEEPVYRLTGEQVGAGV